MVIASAETDAFKKKECTQKTLLPKLAKSFEIIIVLNVVLLLTPLNFSTGSAGM
jgi:hypothetical protein